MRPGKPHTRTPAHPHTRTPAHPRGRRAKGIAGAAAAKVAVKPASMPGRIGQSAHARVAPGRSVTPAQAGPRPRVAP